MRTNVKNQLFLHKTCTSNFYKFVHISSINCKHPQLHFSITQVVPPSSSPTHVSINASVTILLLQQDTDLSESSLNNHYEVEKGTTKRQTLKNKDIISSIAVKLEVDDEIANNEPKRIQTNNMGAAVVAAALHTIMVDVTRNDGIDMLALLHQKLKLNDAIFNQSAIKEQPTPLSTQTRLRG